MGTKRRKWLTASVVAVIAFVVFWIFFHDKEPSYKGKSLSDWVVAMRGGPERGKARAVVHQIGPNYWPILVEWLRHEDRPTMRGRFHGFEEGAQEWMIRHRLVKSHSIKMYFDARGSYHSLGLLAFEELGRDGRAAIPALINLLGDKGTKPDDFSISGAAFLILPKMSPESIGPLIQALSSSDLQTRLLAAGALGSLGTNASAAIPTLETWLHDTSFLRLAAANALGNIGGNPRVFVPIVIASLDERYVESLDHAQVDCLDYSLEILTKYKSEAGSAVPKLIAIYTNTPDDKNSTNIVTRNNVMAALRELDPNAAASLEKK